MDEEYEDLRNWEEWHTPSAEFRAREKAAQKNYFSDWDTYAASLPGQIGSSMSFGGLQLLSTGLNLAGAVAVRTPNPYIAAGGVASTLLGAAAGIVSGVHENRSEVGSNYKDAVIKELQDKDLYEDFMHDMEYQMKKKKLPYHDDEEDKMTDAFNYFLRGDIQSNDQRVRDIARKHLFGAANLFQNDMMAVSADVAFDTTLNLFVPGGGVAKALRITPVGKFNKYSRTLAKISSDHPLIGTVIRRANAVESGIGTQVADAISPAIGRLYRASKVAVPQLNKLHAGVEKFANGMKKGAAKVASFALNSPKALYKAGNYATGVLNFGGQLISRGFSEAIEEGKQYEYGERFKSGGFAGKSNSILETILDDMSTGTSTALAFVGSQFLGIDSDSDLMANMRGGFIGSIFSHGTLTSAYQQGNDTYRKAKAGDIIAQNLMLKRIQERSDIMNAMQFAKYAQQPSKIAAMNEAFDRYIYIQEQLQNNAKDDKSQQYWTREDIESQRKKFQDIVNLSNSGLIRHIMKNSGIDPSSERGHAFIALVDYAQNKAQEDSDIANDHITEFNQLLDSNRLSVDALGNIKSIVDNIKDIENS